MIYLTHIETASTTQTDLIEGCQFPQRVHWFKETYDRVKTGMIYVPHVLANMVLKKEIVEAVKEKPVKSAFILAGGNQQFAGITKDTSSPLNYDYKFLPLMLTQVYAGRTASMFGISDYVSTDASACASSLKVMMDVRMLIQSYGFDRVVVLSVEDAVSPLTMDFFGQSKASMTLKDEDGVKPSAFDAVNGGFYIGQGAVCAVFETEDAMTAYPKAKLLGAYTASEDISNPLGMKEDGEGYRKVIEGALFTANASPEDIAIIKTHGTGTQSNNLAEKTAINGIFNDFVATSYKQKIGHTMGASGLLETGLLLNDIKNGFVPAIENRTERDERFLSDNADVPDGHILCLSAGMGNIFSSAIFSTEP
jgi:3-oxoacyl-(acyl-carrier-protein) synthase